MTERSTPPEPPCGMDDPLPEDNRVLVRQIRDLAEIRRRKALTHGKKCACMPCEVRHYDESRRRAA
jgi:hypothetical protein